MSGKSKLNCTCMNDLQRKARLDYHTIKPCDLYTRLPMMCKSADDAMKQDDDERAYIYLRRWLDSVDWLKTTPEYKHDKSAYQKNMRTNQINQVKSTMAELTQRLTAHYDQFSRKKAQKLESVTKMEVETDSSKPDGASTTDLPYILPEVPKDDPSDDASDEFISCNKLFQLTQTVDSRYLIIDVRQKQQFEASRLSLDKYINIPASEIITGKLAYHFETYLHKDVQACQLFKKRGAQYVDTTILLDWNTTCDTLTPNNALSVLRNILNEWDPGVKNEHVVILDGGYREWLMRYPAYTTNPKVNVPESNDVSNDILEDIEYPDWIHLDDEVNVKPSLHAKPKNADTTRRDKVTPEVSTVEIRQPFKQVKSELNNVPSSRSSNVTKGFGASAANNNSAAQINAVNVQRFRNEDAVLQHKKSSGVSQSEIFPKPIIDRSNKPHSLKASDPDAKKFLNLLRQLNELTKDEEKLQREILEFEQSQQRQRNTSHKGGTEENHIHTDMQTLRVKLEDTQNDYSKTEEELNKYKRMESIRFNKVEKNEQRELDINLVFARRRLKSIAVERKKLHETAVENEPKAVLTKYNDNNIHKESLKIDNLSINSGLERSYSSPNLTQLTDRKAPQVDRSSKPQVIHSQNGTVINNKTTVPRLSWGNREERMIPVHGTVHPGITGLKNLGNSCYMNSIIQCLSNTTPLMTYFTDNSYADDLNTNNENQCQVVEEVAQVIKALWRGQYKSISPYDLKVAIGQYKLQFVSYEQQDSHEFLTFLLEWMHNDLKKKSKVLVNMTDVEKEWDKAMDSQRSIISDLFFGQLKSTITCAFCHEASTTYETFNSLTMSLPHSNRCTLNDCMQRFVSGQKVIGWKCPKCKVPREATKKFDFVKLAPIVVIHLNRFAESGGWLEKRNIVVDFPLTEFDLRPCLITYNDSIRSSSNTRYNYNLYAMSNHYGTMEGGHYTAFCKNSTQNKWYKFDDQTVTEVASSQVKSQTTSAYLLFYTSFSNTYI